MNENSTSVQTKLVRCLFVCTLIVLLGGLLYFLWPYLSIFTDPVEARRLIDAAGIWGAILYILMQVAQVLLAPIPGQAVGLIGGYLFGPVLGLIYTLIGASIGFTLIFMITKRFGRPFVERVVSKKILVQFDHLTKEKGVWVFFFIFLLPAFPDDIISFIAGLTAIPIPTLILISLAGRFPGYAVLCFTGHGLNYENLNPVVSALAAMVVLFAVAWLNRKWLRAFAEHSDRVSFLKESWRTSWKSILVWLFVLILFALIFIKIATIVPIQQ